MKRIMRTGAAVLAAVILLAVLSGCGERISGTYAAEALGTGTVYTFRGREVRLDVQMLGTVVTSLDGTYSLKDGRITLTFGDTDTEEGKKYSGTFDFAETETGIRIGLLEYTKEE